MQHSRREAVPKLDHIVCVICRDLVTYPHSLMHRVKTTTFRLSSETNRVHQWGFESTQQATCSASGGESGSVNKTSNPDKLLRQKRPYCSHEPKYGEQNEQTQKHKRLARRDILPKELEIE